MEQNQEVITLDVREQEEFERLHIPGEKSIPLSALGERLEKLPWGDGNQNNP